jgi:site-specific recombinase XerD
LYRADQGAAEATLVNIARELLVVCQYIPAISRRHIGADEIEAAAQHWARDQQERHRADFLCWSQGLFVTRATQWLRFLDRLQKAEKEPIPFADLIEDFGLYCSRDRGLSPATVRNYRWHIGQFLAWWNKQNRTFSDVSVSNIDEYISLKGANQWTRVSVASCARALKAFFSHAERLGWCSSGIAAAIQSPRIFRQEALPSGPAWCDVRKLIASTNSDKPDDVRDRGILMLFAMYGLRSGEVAKLRLEDFDWERDILKVWRPKQRRTQQFPLNKEVGNAVIRYLREGRPHCACREVFLTLKSPFGPLSPSGLYHVTNKRFARLGIFTPRRGPHALRHACATRLMSEGFSLKEIGDHLGHRSSFATRSYAKVDISGLREIATFDLGGLS